MQSVSKQEEGVYVFSETRYGREGANTKRKEILKLLFEKKLFKSALFYYIIY
jgi:hypothetical protein